MIVERGIERNEETLPVGVRLAGILGEAILTGEYAPGDILPGEIELAQRHGMSRTLVREALKSLGAKGLITARRKAGTQVCPRSDWHLLDPQVLAWRLLSDAQAPLAKDLLAMRAAVEPAAAAAAATRQDKAAIGEIRAAFTDMERTAHDRAQFAAPDLQFHKAILKASGNEFMVAFGALIEAALKVFLTLSMTHKGAPGPSMPLHGDILTAIERADPTAAHQAMQALLSRTSDNISTDPK